MARDDDAIVEGEADPQAVGCDQRQERPQEHPFEQVIDWPE